MRSDRVNSQLAYLFGNRTILDKTIERESILTNWRPGASLSALVYVPDCLLLLGIFNLRRFRGSDVVPLLGTRLQTSARRCRADSTEGIGGFGVLLLPET